MRRICIFCEKWESGGIESFLTNVLLRCDLSRLQVDLVMAQRCPSVFTAPLEAAGVRFVELSGSQRKFRENWQRFRALLRERRYDLVHLNLFQGMSLHYARIAAEEGVPVRIAHSHNAALRKSLLRPVKLALSRFYSARDTRHATELWACSRLAAEFLFPAAELRRRGYTFLPNGIDAERFRFRPEARARVRSELGIMDQFVIGHVGRLCYQKNQSFLLDVLAAMERPDAVLLLVGEGEDQAMLEEKAADLGLSGRVIFYGVTDQPEELYCAMDVFAFPSRFEGLGIVALEAQAAGLPVLCSEHIPEEALVSPNAQALPLDAGADAWGRTLLAMPSDKNCGREALYEKGFDIAEVARRVLDRYLEETL